MGDEGGVLLMCAVGKIYPRDIHAGVDQLFQESRFPRCRPEGRNNFGLPHQRYLVTVK